MKPTLALAALILLSGCGKKDAAPVADTTTASAAPAGPVLVSTTEGFSTPESVLWDNELGVWYVTNINGDPGSKDGNGFISRLGRDGVVDSLRFIQGGRGGVTLNGPCGMMLVGDTLWVADIDALRGFNRRTGAPVASIEFGRQAKFLNDIAVGPDGALYVTDTGIQFVANEWKHPGPDRIFAVAGRKSTIAVEGAFLFGPNGIIWDASASRFLVTSDSGTYGWKPGDRQVESVGKGVGGYDGLDMVGDKLLTGSWTDSSVNVVSGGKITRLISGVESPADFGVDQSRSLLAVPIFMGNKVEFWAVK